ncbi:CsbD family protein [Paraburkholderia sp. LEh10]|uniref:CsbD family protein n=1 Tax=Paraburkholderia sp. LEh10 TaxID=2821353 RepID=UPI0028AA7445|nr:CsbD family protein [Paraburkholderia sp. LEh10]
METTMETTKETTKTEGTLRETAGNVKDAVGSIVGDTRLQLEGSADELRGKAQQLYADASELAREHNDVKSAGGAGRRQRDWLPCWRALGLPPSGLSMMLQATAQPRSCSTERYDVDPVKSESVERRGPLLYGANERLR